jgi:hypothetical protein
MGGKELYKNDTTSTNNDVMRMKVQSHTMLTPKK